MELDTEVEDQGQEEGDRVDLGLGKDKPSLSGEGFDLLGGEESGEHLLDHPGLERGRT